MNSFRALQLRWFCVGLVLFGVLIGVWLTLGRLVFDSQYSLTLDTLMSSEYDGVDTTTDATDVTSAMCGAGIECVEAYDTNEARYYRFESWDSAERFAANLDDGFRSNYIVMDFAGKADASKTRQLWAMQVLAGTWQDYEGGFPAR